jgi:type IV secretory pathway component VirB8
MRPDRVSSDMIWYEAKYRAGRRWNTSGALLLFLLLLLLLLIIIIIIIIIVIKWSESTRTSCVGAFSRRS